LVLVPAPLLDNSRVLAEEMDLHTAVRALGSGSGVSGGVGNQQSQQVRGNVSAFAGIVNRNNNFIPRNESQGFVPQGNFGNNFGTSSNGGGRVLLKRYGSGLVT
jgi:hypothetical protein